MKRKKLNIDIMNNSLKRSELRKITAGCGSGGGTGGGCSYNRCYRAEDFPSVTNCDICVRVDLSTCTATCSMCCIA
jgi:hypothetical protein